jgi:uncharacterized protein (TIGR00369 family)
VTEAKIDVAAARAHLEAALDAHEQTFETFFFAKFLGLEFSYEPENAADKDKTICCIHFPVTDMVVNPQGALHGGAIASVMDISMGHLLRKVAGPGATIEMKIQYLRPVGHGTAVCKGQFVKKGRSLSFMESRLWGGDGKLAALATATWKMPAD